MENEILFSIIIPTYNRANFISVAIESVLNQEYKNFELIIVDDGSTDNTKEVVSAIKDNRIKYYKKENGERGAARNYGASKSFGDYLVYFDSDDIMYQDCLTTAYEFICKNNPAIFHIAYEIKNSEGKLNHYNKEQFNDINSELIRGNPLSCINVFIRKDIAQLNHFNELRTLSGLEDWELWLRMATKYKILYVNKICACLMNHDERSVLRINKDELINRVLLFLNIILSNQDITNFYKKKLYLFKCSCYTYISLHLALTKENKIIAIKYLLKGLIQNPFFIFERRFLAIIKHLLF